MNRFFYIFIIFIITNQFLSAQTLSITNCASGFNNPVDLANAGDERLFVVEQAGRIRIINTADCSVESTPFLNITSIVEDGGWEQGLLGLAFHPDYANNGYFYVNYINSGENTVIARYSVDANNPNQADPASAFIIMTINQPYSNHNGGAIQFGPDGYLYIGTGDGGSFADPQNRAQNGNSMLGKMLRIDVDNTSGGNNYSIPSDNPFLSDANVLDEIWAIGLRNPWKYTFDTKTGDLWIADVGQYDWEEVNFQPASSTGGENYGWRCYEGMHPFNTSGCGPATDYDDPIYEFNHNNGCSITGGYVYRGAKYAGLYGVYLFTDLCSGIIWGTDATTMNTANLGTFNTQEYSSFGIDVYGQMYIAEIESGNIRKIEETANCNPVAIVNKAECENNVFTLGALYADELTYQWQVDGNDIAGATDLTHQPTVAGEYTVVATRGNCSDVSEAVTVNADCLLVETDMPEDLSAFAAFPNPVKNNLFLNIQLNAESSVAVSLFKATGQLMDNQNFDLTAGANDLEMDMTAFAAGMYFIKLETEKGATYRKVLVE